MRAVIWTDVFQSVIIIGGMFAIVIQVGRHVRLCDCQCTHFLYLLVGLLLEYSFLYE